MGLVNKAQGWWDGLTSINPERVKNLLAFVWGFGTETSPNIRNYQAGPHDTTGSDLEPLYWNGIFFIRLTAPFGIFIQLRWGGRDADPALWQGGLGYDHRGRFRIIFRIQSDASAHQGTTIPNDWEAWGWAYGGH